MTNNNAPPEFDIVADNYEAQLDLGISLSGESKDFFVRGRVSALRRWWDTTTLGAPKRILDFGCGLGDTEPVLAEMFPDADVIGTDPSDRCVARATETYGRRRLTFLPISDLERSPQQHFDLIYLNGVIHHVSLEQRRQLFSNLASRLSAAGVLAIFENNPFNPGTRLVMSRIPFDRDAIVVTPRELRRLLKEAGVKPVFTGHYFYFPRALRALRPLEQYLQRIPLGAQYGVFGTLR